ncbi:hypothetical protein D3C76_955430 [compost metagenome]
MEKASQDSDVGAAMEHWVEQLTGKIPMYQGGRITHGSPLAEIDLHVPGIGTVRAHTVGHPEPVTLPTTFTSIRDCSNAMVFSNSLIRLLQLIQARVDQRGQSVEDAASALRKVALHNDISGLSLGESLALLFSSLREGLFGRRYLPAQMSALAEGLHQGRRHVCSAWINGEIPGGMGPNTCVPTAVALLMLTQGTITRRGVFAPEAGIDAEVFFSLLQPFVKDGDSRRPLITLREAIL